MHIKTHLSSQKLAEAAASAYLRALSDALLTYLDAFAGDAETSKPKEPSIDALKKELSESKSTVVTLETLLRLAKETIVNRDAELKAADKTADNLSQKLAAALNKVDDLEAKLLETQKDVDVFKAYIDSDSDYAAVISSLERLLLVQEKLR